MGTKVELAPPQKIYTRSPICLWVSANNDQHPFTQIPCLGLLVTIQDHATMLLGFLSDPALVGHPCEGRASDIYGSPWQSMVIHGYPWISMDVHDSPWFSMISEACSVFIFCNCSHGLSESIEEGYNTKTMIQVLIVKRS